MARRIAHKLESRWRSDDVLRTDVNATFEEFLLSHEVLSGLRKSGFVRPSPIQAEAIPLGLCGFDLVVQAKSGTGKTCVFSTLALQAVDVSRNAVQVLILAPTREIAVQSCDTVCCIGCDVPGLKAFAFIGGVPISEDLRKLSRCHVAAGTLGRLLQLVKQGELRLSSVRLVVLDEADQLLDKSFESDFRELWARLPPKRQVVATSATYSPEVARLLEKELLHQPAVVRLCGEQPENRPTLLGLTEWYCVAKGTQEAAWFSRKVRALVDVLCSHSFSQCLVFLNSQARAQSLVERLSHYGYKAQLLSGAQEQSDRLRALVNLKSFRCRILVSTDLAARGIDAERVNLVINFDVARSLDTHLHRSGRAGRYGTAGQTITIVTGRSELNQLLQLCAPLKLEIRPLPGFPSLEPVDGETDVNGDAPEDDPDNHSMDGDATEESSREFKGNHVGDEGHPDDCGVQNDGSETDPEEGLDSLLLLFANDADATAEEADVLLETEDVLQVPTKPSVTPPAAKDGVLPLSQDCPQMPAHRSPTLTAAKDASQKTQNHLQVPTEPSRALTAVEHEVLPETVHYQQVPTDLLLTLTAEQDAPPLTKPQVQVPTHPSSAVMVAGDGILPEPVQTLTSAGDKILPEKTGPLQVPTECTLTRTVAKDDVLRETAYHSQAPAKPSCTLTFVNDIPSETGEDPDPLQASPDPFPALTAAENNGLPETMYPHIPTNPSPTLTLPEDKFRRGTTDYLQVLTDPLKAQTAARVLLETEDPLQILDPFVECQRPEPSGAEPTPNSKWYNLSWPPEPSVGTELTAYLDTAEETFHRSCGDSNPLKQILVAVFKDHLKLCPSPDEAEGFDAHATLEDDDVFLRRAMTAAKELLRSWVAMNSEAAEKEESCASPDLGLNPTSVTLEWERLSLAEAGENIGSACNGKAASCEMVRTPQFHLEAGLVASDSDAAAVTDIASEGSFVSCYSSQEPSDFASGSEGVSVVQVQADDIVLNLKPAVEEVATQETSLGSLNSDVTDTEVVIEAARKEGPVGPSAWEDLRVPGLPFTQNGVTCPPHGNVIAPNLPCSPQDRWKCEMELDAADVKGESVSKEVHLPTHSLCRNGSGARFNSNGLNPTKSPEKRSAEVRVRKRKSTATWIMEWSNFMRAGMDVSPVCSRQASASLKSDAPHLEQVDVVEGEKVKMLTKKKPMLATANVNSSERVRNVPGAMRREGRQPKVDTSSESEGGDDGLCVQLERRKKPSCSELSRARCSNPTYWEPSRTVVTSSMPHSTNRGPTSRTRMCDQCARRCDAIRSACCEAQQRLGMTAVSSSSRLYSRTQMHASAWSQNWFHWHQWYIREMLRLNGHQ